MSPITRRLAVWTATAIGISTAFVVSGSVAADELSQGDAAFAAVQVAHPSTTSSIANVATKDTGSTAIGTTVNGMRVDIPVDPSDVVSLKSHGAALQVGLPNGVHARDADAVRPGVVTYDNGDGSLTVPIVSKDGSLSFTTVLTSSAAPDRYRYAIATPANGSVLVSDDGSRAIVISGDAVVATIEPAWARDASGRSIATHFETDGKSLTQVIDLEQAGITYPVVADPKFIMYLGFAPSIQLNKAETLATTTVATAGKVCGQAAKYLGTAGGVLCGVSLLQIVAKGAQNVATHQCSWLVLEPPLLLAWGYSGGYCK